MYQHHRPNNFLMLFFLSHLKAYSSTNPFLPSIADRWMLLTIISFSLCPTSAKISLWLSIAQQSPNSLAWDTYNSIFCYSNQIALLFPLKQVMFISSSKSLLRFFSLTRVIPPPKHLSSTSTQWSLHSLNFDSTSYTIHFHHPLNIIIIILICTCSV